MSCSGGVTRPDLGIPVPPGSQSRRGWDLSEGAAVRV